jgi:hypothetical protein
MTELEIVSQCQKLAAELGKVNPKLTMELLLQVGEETTFIFRDTAYSPPKVQQWRAHQLGWYGMTNCPGWPNQVALDVAQWFQMIKSIHIPTCCCGSKATYGEGGPHADYCDVKVRH